MKPFILCQKYKNIWLKKASIFENINTDPVLKIKYSMLYSTKKSNNSDDTFLKLDKFLLFFPLEIKVSLI